MRYPLEEEGETCDREREASIQGAHCQRPAIQDDSRTEGYGLKKGLRTWADKSLHGNGDLGRYEELEVLLFNFIKTPDKRVALPMESLRCFVFILLEKMDSEWKAVYELDNKVLYLGMPGSTVS